MLMYYYKYKDLITKNRSGNDENDDNQKRGGGGQSHEGEEDGKVTVKKGTKKGTYRVRIKVTAAGNDDYRPKTAVIRVKIRIR